MTSPHLRSPWLEQLGPPRAITRITEDMSTDIAIVGAGIAGISTAYFLLKKTRKQILLLEGDRVAHGATGHNAGQLVSYFERPFTDIINEFGLDMASDGQRAIESSWELLRDIFHDLDLQTPYQTFQGYAGCTDLAELMIHLQNNVERVRGNLAPETILVADSAPFLKNIPRAFKKRYTVVPHKDILHLLQTKDEQYFALLTGKKGVMNSARFCEEVIAQLITRYPKRLTLVEHTPVNALHLYHSHAKLTSQSHTITAKRVILCTNGFERLTIYNTAGANIDTKFHHLVRGSVGYMAAFTEKPQMPATAVSYLPSHLTNITGAYDSEPYYYLTRRPYGESLTTSLVCIGGPEALMDDTNSYSKEHPYPKEAKQMIDAFMHRTYQHTGRQLTYTHLWHGLMGYTPNGLRCIGAEPCNPVLLYNLGCNGVGILPSIYGGFRIAHIIKGAKISPSIFDPVDPHCILPKQKRSSHAVPKQTSHNPYMLLFLGLLITAIAAVGTSATWPMPITRYVLLRGGIITSSITLLAAIKYTRTPSFLRGRLIVGMATLVFLSIFLIIFSIIQTHRT